MQNHPGNNSTLVQNFGSTRKKSKRRPQSFPVHEGYNCMKETRSEHQALWNVINCLRSKVLFSRSRKIGLRKLTNGTAPRALVSQDETYETEHQFPLHHRSASERKRVLKTRPHKKMRVKTGSCNGDKYQICCPTLRK